MSFLQGSRYFHFQSAHRGVGAAMSEGRDAIVNRDSRDKEARSQVNAKSGAGGGDLRSHSPWVSSRLASFIGSCN